MCSLEFALSRWRQFQTATCPDGASVAELKTSRPSTRLSIPGAIPRIIPRSQLDTAKNNLPLLHLGDKHAYALGSSVSRLQSLFAKKQKEMKRE
jgi:hypothetical protein